ncbi:MAG: hypothetical protein ACLT8E_02665 [Akkermansia sp.]
MKAVRTGSTSGGAESRLLPKLRHDGRHQARLLGGRHARATLVRWPGVIPANGISLNACQFHDWMATFADAAGVAVPAPLRRRFPAPTLAGVPERQKESLIYSEYNYGGNGASYQDFLSHHKALPVVCEQVVFVDGLKGVRFNISGTDQDFRFMILKRPAGSFQSRLLPSGLAGEDEGPGLVCAALPAFHEWNL